MSDVPVHERIYLRVNDAVEYPTVRALGARWDVDERRFWVDRRWPDAARFARWLPPGVGL